MDKGKETEAKAGTETGTGTGKMEEKLCAYWLCCFQEIGHKKKREMVNFFGSPSEVFRAFDKKAVSSAMQNSLQKHIPSMRE